MVRELMQELKESIQTKVDKISHIFKVIDLSVEVSMVR